MALLFCDSFDGYDNANDFDDKWDYVSDITFASWLVAGGRWGGGAVSIGADFDVLYGVRKRFVSADAIGTIIVGGSFYMTTAPNASYPLMLFQDTLYVNAQLCIVCNSDGTIRAIRGGQGGTVLGTSSSPVVSINTWHHIEVKLYLHDSAGTIEIRVDGAVALSLTAQDTNNTSDPYVGEVRLGTGCYKATNATRWDDIVIMDTSGSYNNNFIGDCRIHSVLPDADGTTNNFTPLGGSTNYTEVDDLIDQDTSYVYSTTSGHKDLYSFDALGLNANHNIAAAVVTNIARKDDIGARSVAGLILSSSTTGTGSVIALPTNNDWTGIQAFFPLDPATASVWAGTSLDSVEAGVMITG